MGSTKSNRKLYTNVSKQSKIYGMFAEHPQCLGPCTKHVTYVTTVVRVKREDNAKFSVFSFISIKEKHKPKNNRRGNTNIQWVKYFLIPILPLMSYFDSLQSIFLIWKTDIISDPQCSSNQWDTTCFNHWSKYSLSTDWCASNSVQSILFKSVILPLTTVSVFPLYQDIYIVPLLTSIYSIFTRSAIISIISK